MVKSTDLASMEDRFTQIERVVTDCAAAMCQPQFRQAFAMAKGVQALRAMITDDMMADIMSLAGSPLGFLTDRDAKGGYDGKIVKDCFIEATLRGAYAAGNEFNIIAGRCYLTKNFFQRVVGRLPGVTNLALSPGVPHNVTGGAIVPFKVTWLQAGAPQALERQIPVRVNEGMGADAVIGKATRKALKAVYERITGSELTPDGDVDDVIDIPGPRKEGRRAAPSAKEMLEQTEGSQANGTPQKIGQAKA